MKYSKAIISEWSGRLGNNLIQLSNGLYFSKKHLGQLDFPKHRLLHSKEIKYGDREPQMIHISRFYDRHDCFHIYPTIRERQLIMQGELKKLINFDLHPPAQEERNNELVIQMRSGDIFNIPPPPKYVPSPLSFFRKVIDENHFDKIIIVCENLKNPCIDKLQRTYPNCRIQSSDLITDIRTIVNAKNLCVTVGTFGYVLSLLNNRLENLYIDNIPKEILDFGFFQEDLSELGFQVHKYAIDNYIRFGEWQNTTAQNQLLLNHPTKDVYYLSDNN